MARVLHVTECYAGGISRAIRQMVSVSPQHEHHLLWSGDEEPQAEHGFKTLSPLPSSPIARIREVHRVSRKLGAQIVHAHSSWAGVYSRALKLPVFTIYQPHCYAFEDSQRTALLNRFYYFVEQRLSPRSDLIIALSDHERNLAIELHQRSRVEVIPNVASLRPDQSIKGSNLVQSKPTIVMVGRICRQKDPMFFLNVAKLVQNRRDDIQFRWIGDGDTEMKSALTSAGVAVTGWLSPEELRQELNAASVYFHSAAYEAFPLSVLDAAAFGLPIVARAISAFDGMNLIQGDDEQDCAEHLLKVIANQQAQVAAKALSRAIDRKMSPQAQSECLHRIYGMALSA